LNGDITDACISLTAPLNSDWDSPSPGVPPDCAGDAPLTEDPLPNCRCTWTCRRQKKMAVPAMAMATKPATTLPAMTATGTFAFFFFDEPVSGVEEGECREALLVGPPKEPIDAPGRISGELPIARDLFSFQVFSSVMLRRAH